MASNAVLVVEDTEADELLILRSLRKANLANDVVVTRDGQQALDWLWRRGEFAERQGPDLPAVVLLDLSLPRIGGLEVLARIRAAAATRLLPVVILTSSDEDCDRLRSYQNGANAYVRKPLEFAEFAEAVGRLGIFWLLVNEPPDPQVGT